MAKKRVSLRALKDLELELLDPQVRKNRRRVESLLARSFLEFGASGIVRNRREIVKVLQVEAPTRIRASSFKINLLAPDIALLTYRTERKAASGILKVLRSSLWKNYGGKWRVVFHQGTRIP